MFTSKGESHVWLVRYRCFQARTSDATIAVKLCCLNHLWRQVEVHAKRMVKRGFAILAAFWTWWTSRALYRQAVLALMMKTPPQSTRIPSQGSVSFLTVGEAADQQRLDNFLHSRLKGAPKSLIYRIIRKGEVRINGKRAKAESRLNEGDQVRVPPLRLTDNSDKPVASAELLAHLEAAVLYRDEHLLVLNKPAGLPVHAGTGMRLGVIEAMRCLLPDYPGLELVHRLDKGTSGCLLMALTGRARKALSAAFREQQVKKTYHLVVAGRWPRRLQRVESALRRQPERSGERRVEVAAEGKPALTEFRMLTSFAAATLMEAKPATGRTHQIRVHATESGHPLLGDDKYHNATSLALSKQLGVRRLCLHAAALQFNHPETGATLFVKAPADEAFKAVLARLEAGG